MADNVNTESQEYKDYMAMSLLPRTLLGGTVAMRDAGKAFLPQNRFETTDSYEKRIVRSFLFNAYKATCSFLSGQVFQKKIKYVGEDSRKETFEEYSKDIDKKGNQLDVFGKRLFMNGVSKGVSHILVEMTNKEPATTKAEEKALGIRPYFREVMPEDVIAFYDDDGNLQQIRIKGTQTVKEGRFGKKDYATVLVLEAGLWELFISDDKGEFSTIADESGTTNLDYIPLVSFIPGKELTIVTGEPPAIDLSYLNLKHWQSSSDQNNILHVGRVPVLFGKKIETKVVPIGTAQMINSNEEGADLKYVEIQGAAIAAGREDLEDTKKEMALYGLRQLFPSDVESTATENTLDSSDSNSNLSTWAVEFEDVMNAAFRIMGDYMGEKITDDTIELNKEYFVGLSDKILDTILKTVEMRLSSRKMAFEELKRRGVYDNDYTFEDMEAELEDEERNNTSFSDIGNEFLK